VKPVGLEHAVHAAPSSAHWKDEPLFVDVNWKLAEVDAVVAAGDEVIDVSGGVVSIVQVKLAGVASRLPSESVACTLNVWLPAARFV
jgi:hypothetical protein